MMISTFAKAGRVFDEPYYAHVATRAMTSLERFVRTENQLSVHYRDGQATGHGFLDDYAYLIDGLVAVFEAGGGPEFLAGAVELTEVMIREFHDPVDGGFFFTGVSHEALIVRTKDATDNATPAASAVAATALLKLAALTGRESYESIARQTLEASRGLIEQAPTAAGQTLIALDFLLAPIRAYAVVGGSDSAEYREALDLIFGRVLPHKVVAPTAGPAPAELQSLTPLLADRPSVRGLTTTYVCERFACQAPLVGVEALKEALAGGPTLA